MAQWDDKDQTKFENWLAGMNYLNSKWKNDYKGLPSPFELYKNYSATQAYQMGKEFVDIPGNIFNFTSEGWEEFIAIQYKTWIVYIGWLWKYSKEFLKDLDLDTYEIEDIAFSNDVALVREPIGSEFNYFLLGYTKVSKEEAGRETEDVYGRPTLIKISNDTEYWKDHEPIDKENFVIFKNNPMQWNKIIENSAYFHLAYRILCEFSNNVFDGQDHYLLLTNPDWDPNANITAQALQDFLHSPTKMLSYFPKMGDRIMDGTDPQDGGAGDLFEDFSKSLQKIEFKDRLDILYNAFTNILNLAYQTLGIPINTNEKKKERQIRSEIGVQQAIPESQKEAMFYCRQHALEVATEKWGVKGWSIEKNEDTEPQEDIEEPDKEGEDNDSNQ